MNHLGQFVVLWRSATTALDMSFFQADGTLIQTIARPTIEFEEFGNHPIYDSFRERNQEIALRGNNFILGEVYNLFTPPRQPCDASLRVRTPRRACQ
jgi:hypothetical protein